MTEIYFNLFIYLFIFRYIGIYNIYKHLKIKTLNSSLQKLISPTNSKSSYYNPLIKLFSFRSIISSQKNPILSCISSRPAVIKLTV